MTTAHLPEASQARSDPPEWPRISPCRVKAAGRVARSHARRHGFRGIDPEDAAQRYFLDLGKAIEAGNHEKALADLTDAGMITAVIRDLLDEVRSNCRARDRHRRVALERPECGGTESPAAGPPRGFLYRSLDELERVDPRLRAVIEGLLRGETQVAIAARLGVGKNVVARLRDDAFDVIFDLWLLLNEP